MEAINTAKNERSHLMGIYFCWEQGADPGVECALGHNLYQYEYKKCGDGIMSRLAVVGSAVVNRDRVASASDVNTRTAKLGSCVLGNMILGTA